MSRSPGRRDVDGRRPRDRRGGGARVVAVLVAMAASAAFAHPPLPEQIDALSARIASEPPSAELYVRRGELHRLEGEWNAALADYRRALALAPADDGIAFLRGRTLQQAGRPLQAKPELDQFLAHHPDHADALIVRARTLAALHHPRAAAADYAHAVAVLPRPEPDHYLEWARLEVAARDVTRALAAIDAGVAKLGPLPSLLPLAIDLELRLHHPDAALARLDAVAAQSPRQEAWLARRGDILRQAGRRDEARAAYEAALAAIEALPAGARQTRAVGELEAKVTGALATR